MSPRWSSPSSLKGLKVPRSIDGPALCLLIKYLVCIQNIPQSLCWCSKFQKSFLLTSFLTEHRVLFPALCSVTVLYISYHNLYLIWNMSSVLSFPFSQQTIHFPANRHENSALWLLKLLQLRQRDFTFSMYYSRGVPQACLPCLLLFTNLHLGIPFNMS